MTVQRQPSQQGTAPSGASESRALAAPDERRSGARRSSGVARTMGRGQSGGLIGGLGRGLGGRLGGRLGEGSEPLAAHFLIPREWPKMAVPMLGTAILMGVISASVPPLREIIGLLAALGIVLASGYALHFERELAGSLIQRLGVMMLAVALPMFLFGMAIADWSDEAGSVSWLLVVGVLATNATIASIILSGRLPAMAAAALALWIAPVGFAEHLSAWLLFAIGAGSSIYAILRQMRFDREAHAVQESLRRRQVRAEEILQDYEQTGQGWFWETDRRGLLTYVSPTVGENLGRSAAKLIGRQFTELFYLDAEGQESERTLIFHLSARSSFSELAVRAATDKEERWWSINGRPVHDSFNNFMGFRGSGSDLTEKKRSAENATRLAHYDSLTGLANRFQMAQTLEKILASVRPEQRACAVFLLDLDRFKQVNDTMGHPAGDALLKQVSQRLEHTVGEYGRVGRLGGDEFQVILPGHIARDDLAHLARRIIENLSQPYLIEGHRVVIGASVGIALSPDDGTSSEELIRNADLALYAAKDGGRGRHHFYAQDLHSEAEERRQLEADLRDAITHGGLELYYQPVVHTTTEKITGFEALLRWQHPVHGAMSPSKFIPVAEEAGMIAAIGEWALRTACADLAKWPETVRVAVNVSPLQFANPALPSIVTSALASAQIAPHRLELEITESVFLNDDEGTEAMFTALKRVGVRLALDDFGTGYSSLGYLKKAPFDKIKIDQSFVRGATIKGSRNGAIISSIVSLAEALGMETTAEGVETLDELDLVRMLGCSHVQGFIYEKPLNATSAGQRLQSGLIAIAQGPRSARAVRQTMLRKIVLEHNGQSYQGTIRNISQTGALVEGLWNVPPGTIFAIMMAEGQVVTATARWCQEDRMGVEFAAPLHLEDSGRVSLSAPQREDGAPSLRRTG